ncbi:hypothetical protein OBBRIDRAFT_837458 [Obba rivulosa]|uniref:Uncharacterized protein n=1 Tax=Obba rivulosa TaxID=1052685 RepID=A0A8E2DGQ9_9APHY|nr:hypothetical protein OBBRIDRAFT_837458 [Obba rivulosa]
MKSSAWEWVVWKTHPLTPDFWETAASIRECLYATRSLYFNTRTRFGKLAVASEYQRDIYDLKLSSSSFHIKRIKFCLNFLNTSLRDTLIEWCEPGQAVDDATPQLFIRSDAPLEQKASILALFASCVPSEQLSWEIDQSRVIEPFLSQLLREKSGLCQIIPNEGVISVPRVVPLVAVTRGALKVAMDQPQLACARVAYALQRTLIILLLHHYQCQGWQLNCELSESDVEIPMNKHLFVYSIVYNTECWTVLANYPDIRQDDSGKFRWFFRMRKVETIRITKPLSISSRLWMVKGMLAVEQHTHLLCSLLQLSY